MSSPVVLTIDPLKKNAKYKHPGMPPKMPVFVYGDNVKGKFAISVESGALQHKGVTIALRGVYKNSDGQVTEQFFEKTLEILPPGTLTQSIKCPYTFSRVAIPYGTYIGRALSLVYFVECCMNDTAVVKQLYFVRPVEVVQTPFCKSIGIINVIHFDVVFQSTCADVRKCFLGALCLSLSKIRMVHINMELCRIERMHKDGECVFESELEKLMIFEVMDGAPVRGTIIPMRIFVGGCKCWPSPKESGCRISCEYFFQIRGIDETGRSYKKKIPIDFVYEK